MVQVDIVWSYAFGATFAAAAARQLEKEEKPFNNKWYVLTLLFLACLFAPSGLYLLWQFPGWETMQVATRHEDIPAWLVVVFAVTNITQGILGYRVSYLFARKGKYYAAHANWMVAWIIFWFILVCGWDCTGYQRFLYDSSMFNGELWTPGRHMGFGFFLSNVWWTLVVMGLFFAPALNYGIVKGIRKGAAMDPSITKNQVPRARKILLVAHGTMFGLCLGLAILAALCVMSLRDLFGNILLGYLVGIPAFSVVAYFLLFRRKMPMYLIAKQLFVKESGD